MINFLNIFKSGSKGAVEIEQKTINPDIPKCLQTTYTADHAAFVKWTKFHRDHQNEAVRLVNSEAVGQISLPTGTGKTRAQVHIHVEEMIKNTDNDHFGVHVIGAHRLALCNQLLHDLVTVVVNAGLPFDILFIGSDRFADDRVHAEFRNKGLNKHVNEATSTTRQDEVFEAWRRAQSRKRHLVVVSTYHSFNKLKVIPEIDICTYDEAHTLVGESFMENILEVKPRIKRNYYFTATRRIQGSDGGMNRKDVFGEVLYERSPRSMIEAGEIVPPKLHIIDTSDEGDFDNHTMMVRTVVEGFNQHKALVKQHSCLPESIGAKVIVTTTGSMEMMELHNDAKFQEFCVSDGIRVFAFSSEYGSFVDFKKTSRDAAMKEMRSLPDSVDAIMIHIDILTEGIDLPSITGVMPFRELNSSKLIQTIGRAARLIGSDRTELYAGRVMPCDWEGYIKPCCWIIIPRFFRSLGDPETMKSIIRNIINTYEVPVSEYSVVDNYRAHSDGEAERITEHDHSTRKERESDLTHLVEDIIREKIGIMERLEAPIQAIENFFRRSK